MAIAHNACRMAAIKIASSDGHKPGTRISHAIHMRPPEIEDRLIPGHWEGDLVKGEGSHSSVGILCSTGSPLNCVNRLVALAGDLSSLLLAVPSRKLGYFRNGSHR